MKPTYSLVLETTGIHDAIIDSGLKIPINERLLLWFDENWSPKSNTFVTLEDIMILGGFFVLGALVTCQVESPEDHAALAELVQAYKVLARSRSKRASLSAWMNIFKGTQNALEHEAFLAFWLSEYLFAYVKDTVLPETFHLAILLAKGRRIALTHAILATLYQDLHFLQDAIIDFVWRPYANNTNHFISKRVYVSYASWKEIENEEVESYARCLRACKLVDLDIGQDYSSHRVCRQFGYAQDIPTDILQIEDNENAWAEYFTPLTGSDVYIPSRKYEGQVSARYEDRWEKEPVSPSNPQVPLLPNRRRKRISAN